MRIIFLVKPEEAETARRMEQKLLSLPEAAGILFVGVEVVQDPLRNDRWPLYKLFVGCSREREVSLIEAVIRRYLVDEAEESQLIIDVRRGIARS